MVVDDDDRLRRRLEEVEEDGVSPDVGGDDDDGSGVAMVVSLVLWLLSLMDKEVSSDDEGSVVWSVSDCARDAAADAASTSLESSIARGGPHWSIDLPLSLSLLLLVEGE